MFSPLRGRRESPEQNSEDILESDCKDTITGNKIQYKILNLQNLQVNSPSLLDRIQNECSHNVSIEEFRNDLQNTQKVSAQSKVFHFPPPQEEGLLMSWNMHKAMSRDLQLQFDLNRQGSHLNSPVFQSNRSLEKVQENLDPN
mmetsp:Transcript_24468/g.24049  ORF Transcript_24468/g.24049 Transcript_24468/m.24049 type:complete len:143 (-) Transcript_24468:272-700(-)